MSWNKWWQKREVAFSHCSQLSAAETWIRFIRVDLSEHWFFCIIAADPVWHHCCKWDHGYFGSYYRPSGHEEEVCLIHVLVFLPYTINKWTYSMCKPCWILCYYLPYQACSVHIRFLLSQFPCNISKVT